jgi:hypothetical protein
MGITLYLNIIEQMKSDAIKIMRPNTIFKDNPQF